MTSPIGRNKTIKIVQRAFEKVENPEIFKRCVSMPTNRNSDVMLPIKPAKPKKTDIKLFSTERLSTIAGKNTRIPIATDATSVHHAQNRKMRAALRDVILLDHIVEFVLTL